MKTKITLLIILIYNIGYTQLAVVDAGVNTTLASQLTNSTSQLAQLQKSYELLKEASEKVEKVSNMIKSINDMGEIISLQKEAISNVNLILNQDINVSTSTLKKLNTALGSISLNIGLVSKILSNGLFTMTDKDRIDFFEDTRRKILIDVVKTRIIANKYKN
ncbi:MAG: hypothetical protein HC854_04035 [Flavobacterium sp.]|nr:hypothetical protein [Flavobacterium sp.]